MHRIGARDGRALDNCIAIDDPRFVEGVEPRPAATVVLVRDSKAGPEVLLTVRPDSMKFMGGAMVFPGGTVTAADRDPRWEAASAISAAEASERLGEPDERAALAAYVCAMREAFEEVGWVAGEGDVASLERADADDAERWLAACLERNVRLATDRMIPAGRWVTPLGAPIRFDAHFFVTSAGDGFEPVPDPDEVAECKWITPAQALAELGAGKALMAPPTVEMLQRLEGFTTIAELLEAVSVGPRIGNPRILRVRLSPQVQVVLAPNPGVMTGPGTNTYVVGADPSLVIDPAVDDDDYLESVLDAAGEVAEILVTHRHPDHVGGVAALKARTGARVRAWGGEDAGGAAVDSLSADDTIESGGVRLRTIHAPGHASDHVCFLMEGAASLFAGDNILGEGTAVIAPPDGNMRDYLQTLERLKELHIDRIYPGHFRPLDGGTRVIDSYIAHRREREAAILRAVAAHARSVDEIVGAVYTDTPPGLHSIARFTVLAHLEMMSEEGRVEARDDLWQASTLNQQ